MNIYLTCEAKLHAWLYPKTAFFQSWLRISTKRDHTFAFTTSAVKLIILWIYVILVIHEDNKIGIVQFQRSKFTCLRMKV